jgi:hypothetical protein
MNAIGHWLAAQQLLLELQARQMKSSKQNQPRNCWGVTRTAWKS